MLTWREHLGAAEGFNSFMQVPQATHYTYNSKVSTPSVLLEPLYLYFLLIKFTNVISDVSTR